MAYQLLICKLWRFIAFSTNWYTFLLKITKINHIYELAVLLGGNWKKKDFISFEILLIFRRHEIFNYWLKLKLLNNKWSEKQKIPNSRNNKYNSIKKKCRNRSKMATPNTHINDLNLKDIDLTGWYYFILDNFFNTSYRWLKDIQLNFFVWFCFAFVFCVSFIFCFTFFFVSICFAV